MLKTPQAASTGPGLRAFAQQVSNFARKGA